MSNFKKISFSILVLFLFSCAQDNPYLSGHIRRATDAVMTSCDPYNQGDFHTCLIFASAFSEKLVVFDASIKEFVLAPMGFSPLYVKVGVLTSKLCKVTSTDKKFPYFLALDHGLSAIYAVRTFPSKDDKVQSFSTPKAQSLTPSEHKPFQIAAFEDSKQVYALISYRDASSLLLVALDKNTGLINPHLSPKFLPVGVKPSHIVINSDARLALISDEGSNFIHKLDLTNIEKVLTGASKPIIDSIDVKMATDKIYLSARDFGLGKKEYLLALKAEGSELLLLDISDKGKSLVTIKPKIHPQVAYFPDAESDSCCNGEKSWFAIGDLKGQVYFYTIKNTSGMLSLKESEKALDLTSESNLALSQLMLTKIIGGKVEEDASFKQENSCKNNRQMFYIANWGSDRPRYWSRTDSMEVETPAWSCEGSDSASRFGYKRD